jgi:hypothetical protein
LNSGTTGTLVTGSPNTFPGVIVDFSSTQSLSDQSGRHPADESYDLARERLDVR